MHRAHRAGRPDLHRPGAAHSAAQAISSTASAESKGSWRVTFCFATKDITGEGLCHDRFRTDGDNDLFVGRHSTRERPLAGGLSQGVNIRSAAGWFC
ncbi:protein of unknown function [Methylocella tundrae]|uniref:Uncharacterized protein n=1 Tax=Methylocella tundrae TaxID=227605 RepID=A0A4U8Z6N4_METTU|nr:protein of unknown function [Methylocella tundrae]